MQLYRQLSQVGFLRTYSVKFLFVAFLGIHIPLIGIIIFITLNSGHSFTSWGIIAYTLALTLVATGITLVILNQLIKPILLAKEALHGYLINKELPSLPEQYTDEIGVLLRDIQTTVTSVDSLLQEKRDLVSMLSHDLRTPTITILDVVRLLKESPEEQESLPQYLEQIKNVGEKQLQLMDTVLTLLKNEQRMEAAIQKKTVVLAPMIRGTILQLHHLMTQKKLQIKQHVSATLKVNVDPSSFEQVLSNLMVNAVKFSHPGQTISIEAEEKENRLFLHFKDQGIGFAPDAREKIFDRFTQFRQLGTAGEATNGVGLYLCQKIMRQHGGALVAHSAGVGQGATFTIELSKN
ncbi:sensor histidine kinase [Rufibacter quisquiliarum]|uniref:histidine kinase n=1 Tax=Rufibacter quisquiliarum TaxID=1549639 RepID=A0A839GIT8_9BACT|nr:HAMP domain-containing sensor histidine kinase [Rufibacter quisquiliarum]MBA9078540.1 signal transduction histidine kinase [Rufibacter quisquiliarum]